MSPLISIIIPVYNTENYLKRCLDSIIIQTYKFLEIILIDDGSTDSSGKICDAYTEKDDRIAVIHKNNEGVSTARNLGSEKSKGDYISFVDSDDWLEADAYEHLIEYIIKYKVDAVIFEYYIDYIEGYAVHKTHKKLEGIISADKAIEITISPVNRFVWSKLYHRNLVDGIKFDKKIYIGEDTLFACQALDKANSVYYYAKPIYHYIQSRASATRGSFNKKVFTGIDAYKRLVDLSEQKYPSMYDISISAYITLVINIMCQLYANLDYPNAIKIIQDLHHEVRKYSKAILLSNNISIKLKLKIILNYFNPKLICIFHSS